LFLSTSIMIRSTNTFIFILISIILSGQCPDLLNNTLADGSTNTMIGVCGSDDITFTVNDPNLPNGTIDWYSSTVSGFDPTTSGTLEGNSSISSNAAACLECPIIESIYIDACGTESNNEFVVISSGSGFAVDDLSFSFDDNNNWQSAADDNINTGGLCTWFPGETSLFSGCSNIFSIGPGDYVPPNSLVIMQASRQGATSYDISSLCGLSDCIYVLSNSCQRTAGGFSNCGAGTGNGSERTNTLNLACGCSDVLEYDILHPDFLAVCGGNNNGFYVLADLSYGNNGCVNGPTIPSINQFSTSATVDPYTYMIDGADCNTTQYLVGVLNSSEYEEGCCGPQMTEEYAFTVSCATAQLFQDEDGILCPGECETYSVDFVGGDTPYDLDVTVTGGGFPISGTLPGFPLGAKIEICYDTGGPLFDDFTINVPAIPFVDNFNATFELDGFVDDNGCVGTILGTGFNISFNAAPDIFTPNPLEACDIGNGSGFFILEDLDNEINGGSGDPVSYFFDAAATIPISSPYQSNDATIYAQILQDPCDSEIVPVELDVVVGDVGVISMFCSEGGILDTDCLVCDDDGTSGEEVEITVIFQDPTITYDIEVVWTSESGPSSTILASGTGTITFTHNIFEMTTFQITSVTEVGGCVDLTDLGNIVTIEYGLEPMMEAPMNLEDCSEVVLPPINGDLVPGNAAYYDMPNGMGTMYAPGDIINTTTTLYLYAGIDGCSQEFSFEVTIAGVAMIDPPVSPIAACGSYQLPPITGTNVSSANYYTEIDGGGNILTAGQIITFTTTLYLFSPDCPGNQPELNITITPGPSFETNDTTVCDFYIIEPIEGSDLSGNESYYEMALGLGLEINVGDTIFVDSIIHIYDNTPGCEVSSFFNVTIKEPSFPGRDTTIVLCLGDQSIYDLNALLAGEDIDDTGIWIENTTTDLYSDSTMVDFSSLSIGQYDFTYFISDTICVDTQAVITIDIIDAIDAGNDAVFTVCEEITIDVFTLLGNPTGGGTFYDDDDMVVTFDPSNATFNTDTPGTEVYRYIVGDITSPCGTDTSLFTVITDAGANAGDDNSTIICDGLSIDLTTLLNNNSGIGSFVDPDNTGAVIGQTFDSNQVADGNYTIYHIIVGSAQCPSDTAFLTINVEDGPSAGDNVQMEVCGIGTLDLETIIDSEASIGGDFYDSNSMLLTDNTIDLTTLTSTTEYTYIVGDDVTCPMDSSIITINTILSPSSSFAVVDQTLCPEECTGVEISVNGFGSAALAYYTVKGSNGELENRTWPLLVAFPFIPNNFCNGENGLAANEFAPGETFTIILDSIFIDNQCTFYFTDSIEIETLAESEFMINQTFCSDTIIMVGPDTYNMANPNGMTVLQNGASNGCDSTVFVDLTFSSSINGNFDAVECAGGTVSVFGIDYTDNYEGDTLLIGASVAGCDSLVSIDIDFVSSIASTVNDNICEGESITIGGVEFTEETIDEEIVLPGGSVNGCDSTITVTVLIDSPESLVIDDVVCASYSTMINGTQYDINNPTGQETIFGAATNGCDSIYDINLDFSLSGIDSTFTYSTCDDDYFIVVGGEVFNRTNTSGDVTVPAANNTECDTTFTIDLTYGEMLVDFEVINATCEVVDSGFVVIDEINGVAPYSLVYNGNNTIAFVLPVEINLPIGLGDIMITDDEGCSSMIEYEILEGEEGDFSIAQSINQLTIVGGTPDSISWSPSEGLSCDDCEDPIVDVTETTDYTATIFYGGLCDTMINVQFFIDDNVPDYIFPNVISPNADNQNENFTLFITEGAIGVPVSMSIYDRWGNLMFRSMNPSEVVETGWNGRLDGTAVEQGVYVYHVQVMENNEVINLYGDLTVIR